MDDIIKIDCTIASEMDESGADGLYDFAGDIALDVAFYLKENFSIEGIIQLFSNSAFWSGDFGQDVIYQALRAKVKEKK